MSEGWRHLTTRSIGVGITRAIEPLTADDDAIRLALQDAFLPALLPALAQATGDFSLLRDELRPYMGDKEL